MYWLMVQRRTKFVSMQPHQTIAYISDVGSSSEVQPFFAAGCFAAAVLFNTATILDKHYRYGPALVDTSTTGGLHILPIVDIFFALLGTMGLCLLTIFDIVHWPRVHWTSLCLFGSGYLLNAVFVCCEYHYFGKCLNS